jgi:hypothetical protein
MNNRQHEIFIETVQPRHQRRGMALYLVLSVVFIMALIMPVYFSFSLQLSFSSFTQLNEERLALFTRTAHDAVFAFLNHSGRKTGSRIATFFLDSIKSSTADTMRDLEREPELVKLLETVLPPSVTVENCKFRISMTVMEQNRKNAEDKPYYPGEGLAVVEVQIISSLYKGRTLLTSCRYTRQYDLKSVCLAASDTDQYSMGFPLRYALFVRDAEKESGNDDSNEFYANPDQCIKIADTGDIYLHNLLHKITTRGNYVSGHPKVYNYLQTQLHNVNTAKGPSGFRPFRNATLYACRFNGAQSFLDSGIYNQKTGELHLPGIVDIQNEHLILPKPQNGSRIKVFGKGALIVPEGITINSGIELNSREHDLCVIFTRKNSIIVNSVEPIEASLLAFTDKSPLSGGVKCVGPFKIFGSLGVDRLFWHSKPFVCEIEYDKRLKPESAANEIFQITFSPWIRFENKIFSRQDLIP